MYCREKAGGSDDYRPVGISGNDISPGTNGNKLFGFIF
jgi:hypothetical protein